MSDLSLIKIGISSLMAYKTALGVASNNIANANTPFYSRREVDFAELAQRNGVDASNVRRIFDEAANRYAQKANSDFSQSETYLQQMRGLEPIFDDETTNIAKYINDSLDALNKLNSDASSVTNRTLYMEKLNALASRFQNINGELNRQIQNVNLSLSSQTKQVNEILTRLSGINREISVAIAADHDALLDQREQLVQELAQYFDFSAQVDQNGLLNIGLSNGLSLLSSDPPAQFNTSIDPRNPAKIVLNMQQGANTIEITDLIHSGNIAGLLNFQRNTLDDAQRTLGRLALVFSDKFNAQNHLGVTQNGSLGGNIFADINAATAMASRVIANTNNSGSSVSSVSIDDVSQLKTSDYRLSIGAANSYILTRISDSTVVSSGTIGALPDSISVDGFTLNLTSGTFTAGDQYTISPTYGAADNIKLAITDSAQLALAWPVTASVGVKSPESSGQIRVDSIEDTTTTAFTTTPGQLSPPIQIRFLTDTTYELIDPNNPSPAIEGPIAYDPNTGADIFPTPGSYDPGYRVSISGVMKTGDTFNIDYNANPGSHSENGLQFAKMYRTGTVEGQATGDLVTFTQAYTLLSNSVSLQASAAQTKYSSDQVLKKQAEQRRDAISGVSLEEETLNLARFQQAYQASAQILETARKVLEIVTTLAR